MIRGFFTILGAHRRRLVDFLIWVVIYGVAHGLAMLVLVLVVQALLRGDYERAIGWLWVLVVLVVICCIASYVQSMKGMRNALVAMGVMHHRLGDHLLTLPGLVHPAPDG